MTYQHNSPQFPSSSATKKSSRLFSIALLVIPLLAASASAALLTTSVTGGHGTIAPATADHPSGSLVELTTTPDPGYRAAVWTGTDNDSLITANNFVTMNGDKTVTVQFEPIPVVDTEVYVHTSPQPYFTSDEWLTFSLHNGRNLYREADGTLHMAFVDHYELWYSTSRNGGHTWSTQKVPTGLDGKVRYAVMTVDQNGKVFIGITANPAYNYANNTVGSTNVYRYDVHAVNNVSGSWVVNKLHTSVSGWGYFVSGIAVDADNDVHLFATRYGWYAESQGQKVMEWVWDGVANTWGGITTVFHYTTGGNHICRWYTPTVVDSSGTITLFGKRNTYGKDVLFYVNNSGGSWGTPVNIETEMDATSNGHNILDAAIDKNNVIHLVYCTNNDGGQTEIMYSDDLGATKSVIYTGTAGQSLHDLKLHSDADGNLTAIFRRVGESAALIEMAAGDSAPPTAVALPTIAPDGDVGSFGIAQTDTANGVFTGCELFYSDSETAYGPRPATPPYGPYGPIIYYYNNLAGLEPIPDVGTEILAHTSQPTYTSDEWLTFATHNGRNLYREADGTLHMAFVDNYELWYSTSVDGGRSWSTEKVPTGLDGKVRYTVMTVDQNGKVFIGVTANPAYNYANNTVSGTNVYRYDVHAVNNASGSWVMTKLHTSVSGWGYFVSGIAVDADNDVHLFSTRYGWYAESNGQKVMEWVWDGDAKAWGGITTAFHHSTGGNHICRWYTPTVVDSSGTITLFGKRNTSGDDVLFYVTNSGGGWGTPVTIEANMNPTWNGHTALDAAIDQNDVIHLVYFTNNDAGLTEILYSDDLGVTTKAIYTGTAGQRFFDLKIHSDADGNLTTVFRREGESTALLKKAAGDPTWSDAVDLPSDAPDGDVYYLSIAQTDTANGVFTGCELFYVDNEAVSPPRPATPPYGPYAPVLLYYNNLFVPDPAELTLTMTSNTANLSTSNLTSSVSVRNVLQMTTDLASESWSNLYSVSGVTVTNWSMPVTTNKCYYRIKNW